MKLLWVQNNAARLVLIPNQSVHPAEMVRVLPWLLVRAQIEHKIAFLCFLCFGTLKSCAPSYLQDFINTSTQQRYVLGPKTKCLYEHP